MFIRRAAFEKNLKSRPARPHMFNFSLKFKCKAKKKVITSAEVLFFTEIQRGAVEKIKNRLWLYSC